MSANFFTIKLRQPTDFLILEVFYSGENLNAPAAAYRINNDLDTNREVTKSNINTRLPELAGYGLLEKIPPKATSGLYRITIEGQIALENREKYDDPEVDFVDLIIRMKQQRGDSGAI